MAETSTIEWTDATWNPITGCSVVSPGCTNCYAMKLAGTRLQHHPSRAGLTKPSKAGPVWTGEVRLNAEWLDQPLRWKRPRRIFVCAHGDLFHESVPDEWIVRVFAVMAAARQHTFQVLTKRAERMRHFMLGAGNPAVIALPNVWLGVSAEDQKRADERIPHLLDTPAAVRFVSIEPLLGAVDLRAVDVDGHSEMDSLRPSSDARPRSIDWVIAGGESGPEARPMHPDWVRSLRDQCTAAGVSFFLKQWGEWREFDTGSPEVDEVDNDSEIALSIALTATNPGWISRDGRLYRRQADLPEGVPCRLIERVGKKAAGAMLDGREWREMPR